MIIGKTIKTGLFHKHKTATILITKIFEKLKYKNQILFLPKRLYQQKVITRINLVYNIKSFKTHLVCTRTVFFLALFGSIAESSSSSSSESDESSSVVVLASGPAQI